MVGIFYRTLSPIGSTALPTPSVGTTTYSCICSALSPPSLCIAYFSISLAATGSVAITLSSSTYFATTLATPGSFGINLPAPSRFAIPSILTCFAAAQCAGCNHLLNRCPSCLATTFCAAGQQGPLALPQFFPGSPVSGPPHLYLIAFPVPRLQPLSWPLPCVDPLALLHFACAGLVCCFHVRAVLLFPCLAWTLLPSCH